MRIVKKLTAAALIALSLTTVGGFYNLMLPDEQAGMAEAAKHRSSARRSTSTRRHQTHSRSRRGGHRHVTKKPTRYAYPLDFFMARHPHFDKTPLPEDVAQKVRYAFRSGTAEIYPPSYLVRSGAFTFYPLRGGIFKRREKVKYIIVHSTETGVPQNATRVVDSWSSGGLRHPGTQYLVDRDGTIVEAVDPEYGAVHVNIFKTLPGINNDNSIGIEMCHAGNQTYPPEQRASVIRLVSYLQDRYHVLNENVITHRYAQQGDHTDPVAFDFEAFLAAKDDFRTKAIALKRELGQDEIVDTDLPVASVYLEMHRYINPNEYMARKPLTEAQLESARKEVERLWQAYAAQKPVPQADVPAVATDTSRHPEVAKDKKPVAPPAVNSKTGSSILPLRDEIEVDPAAASLLKPAADTSQ